MVAYLDVTGVKDAAVARLKEASKPYNKEKERWAEWRTVEGRRGLKVNVESLEAFGLKIVGNRQGLSVVAYEK